MLELLKGPTSSDGDGKRRHESEQLPIQTIYWGELYLRTRITTKNQRDRAIRGRY